MAEKRIHLIISGIVQGVFFRAHTREKARQLGLVGWVMNREDGSVECVAEGEESALRSFLEWCKVGPPSARVSDVKVEREEPKGEFSSFFIRY
ncbi:MAG: acylphosphatase [Candidatus Micrarchaeia archaeon]